MNAGPKKPLRAPDAMDSAAEPTSKLNDVLWCTIGQRALGFGPHKLIGIELWGIGWKSMHMESLVLANELLDDDAPVDGAAIPEQHHRSAQVPEEVTQEADDLHSRNVVAVETEVKSKPLARWGDGDCGDGRNPVPPVAVSKNRGMADRRPGLAHVGDEKESAFVEEYEMGPKSLGFFLTRATASSSNVRWLARFSAWPGVPASAMSIVNSPSLARHGPGGSESQSASESVSLYAVGSTDPLCSRPPEPRVSKAVTTPAAARATIEAAVLAQAWAAERLLHRPGSSEPSAPLSLWTHSESRPRIGRSDQPEVRRWPAVCVPPAVEEFHRVSCSIA